MDVYISMNVCKSAWMCVYARLCVCEYPLCVSVHVSLSVCLCVLARSLTGRTGVSAPWAGVRGAPLPPMDVAHQPGSTAAITILLAGAAYFCIHTPDHVTSVTCTHD
jgi:hypothetical protein